MIPEAHQTSLSRVIQRTKRNGVLRRQPNGKWANRSHMTSTCTGRARPSRLTKAGKTYTCPPGRGDLPRPSHKAIRELPLVKLLEQNCTEAEVVGALDFIESLG